MLEQRRLTRPRDTPTAKPGTKAEEVVVFSNIKTARKDAEDVSAMWVDSFTVLLSVMTSLGIKTVQPVLMNSSWFWSSVGAFW